MRSSKVWTRRGWAGILLHVSLLFVWLSFNLNVSLCSKKREEASLQIGEDDFLVLVVPESSIGERDKGKARAGSNLISFYVAVAVEQSDSGL